MKSAISQNPNASNVTTEIEVGKDGSCETVLVVSTPLELDATDPAYNKSDVDQLLADAIASITGSHDRALIKSDTTDGGTF